MNKISLAYNGFKARCKELNNELDMTKDEFIGWWNATGHVQERGPGRTQYCMSRIDSSLPYNTANVECITNDDRYAKTKFSKGIRVSTPHGVFPCLEIAHKTLHMERKTIRKYCMQARPGWSL